MERRSFLKASAAGGAAFAFSGLVTLAPRRARAATVQVDLVAESQFATMVDGADVFTWRFRDPSGSGPGALKAGLVVQEGDSLEITVTNNLARAINLEVPGYLTGTAQVDPGGTQTYTFDAPGAGSYLFTDGVSGEIGRAMGLMGPLVVMPGDGSNALYEGGPTFDRQYTLVLSDFDTRLNEAIYNGSTFDMADYEPNYFFANGLSYPDTADYSDTLVSMSVGEDVALRFINGGAITNPMHFHGYHADIATRDREPVSAMGQKDTVQVHRDECVDMILPVAQDGTYPLHTHFVPGVTANGVYPGPYGGALLLMSAS